MTDDLARSLGWLTLALAWGLGANLVALTAGVALMIWSTRYDH